MLTPDDDLIRLKVYIGISDNCNTIYLRNKQDNLGWQLAFDFTQIVLWETDLSKLHFL
jgi:hypothetical protein